MVLSRRQQSWTSNGAISFPDRNERRAENDASLSSSSSSTASVLDTLLSLSLGSLLAIRVFARGLTDLDRQFADWPVTFPRQIAVIRFSIVAGTATELSIADTKAVEKKKRKFAKREATRLARTRTLRNYEIRFTPKLF